jgi:hypothetical protein
MFYTCRESQQGLDPFIFVWELGDKKRIEGEIPAPYKVIAWENDHLFRLVWDATNPSQDSWPEKITIPFNDAPICSFQELSPLFKKTAFSYSTLANCWKDPNLKGTARGDHPTFLRSTAFQNGKFFSLCSDQKTSILCADFTASDREILEHLVTELESEDLLAPQNARERFEKMPKPVQGAVNLYVDALIHEMLRQPNPNPQPEVIIAQEIRMAPLLATAIRKYLEDTKPE